MDNPPNVNSAAPSPEFDQHLTTLTKDVAKEEPVVAVFRYAFLAPLSFPSKTAAAAAI